MSPAVQGPRPYNIDHLLGGGSRILVSDDTVDPKVDIPAKLEDVVDNTFPYAPVDGWADFGATKEGASYTREISSEGYEIQQATGNVLEEVTEVVRTLNVSVAEFRKEHFKILEESETIETVAASTSAPKSAAQELVKFGGITDLTHRRMVAIGMRSKQSGVVVESATRSRGRFLALVLYDVAIAADSSEVPLEKGSLSTMPIAFRSYPEGGEDAGTEHGLWLDEQAATFV